VAPVDIDVIEQSALDMTETAEPDLEPFHLNLELLVDCINEEAGLTPEGGAGAERELALALRNRIEVSDWIRRYPEITREAVSQPIVLTGLPRSGTTYFQYLFDPGPSMRMLRHWEGDRPCPPPAFDPESAQLRLEQVQEQFNRDRADPLRSEIAKIHLMDPDGPEECLAIINQTFGNVGHYWTYRVPTYFARCLDTIDLAACYAHHKRVLQLLQWKATPRRWVLKWPCHLVALQETLDVYPDAKFVVTHRDPVQALASNCSLAALLRGFTSERVDLHEVGQQMKDMILTYLRRLVQFDEVISAPHRIVHVDYATVVDQPEAVMTRVFEQLHLEMTPSVRVSIAAWRRDNPPGKRGVHDYSLEDYGLDRREVAEEYAFYADRFDVPTEGARVE
jgi:Sulfotransferase family